MRAELAVCCCVREAGGLVARGSCSLVHYREVSVAISSSMHPRCHPVTALVSRRDKSTSALRTRDLVVTWVARTVDKG